MVILDLIQGSEAWLNKRRTMISATDCAAICHQNAFKHPWDLYDEKLGFKEPEPLNDAMRRGSLLENDARILASLDLRDAFNPIVAVHDDYPWAMASLDGINSKSNTLLEIKSPGEKKHREHCNQIVSPAYLYQIYWQMFVTGCDKCFFMSYRPESAVPVYYIEINKDPVIISNAFQQCKDFYYNNLTAFKRPEPNILVLRN